MVDNRVATSSSSQWLPRSGGLKNQIVRYFLSPKMLVLAALVWGPLPAQAETKPKTGVIQPASMRPKVKLKMRDRLRARRAEVDVAATRGLAWLAKKQNAKGFWSATVGTKSHNGYRATRNLNEQTRSGTGHVGVTALCGMAFLSGGHLPNRGKYRVVVNKTVEAVLSVMQDNGLITLGGTNMYSHAIATLFLAEVYGMTRSPKIKKGLERATHMIIDCQNAQGGWRYQAFSKDADLSVTVCQLQSLRAARNIGIQIPRSIIDRAIRYVKDSQIPSGRAKGRYYYSIKGNRPYRKRDSFSIQAAAVTSLVSAGVYERELIEPALDFLTEELEPMIDDYSNHFFFWYGHYYASQAFFHAERMLDNGCFERYYSLMRDHLLAEQQSDGRWLNPRGEGPGDPFGTSVACIILQIPNQYLPIFQR